MKYILIIGDGMADNPVAELNGMTPLEQASIPTIDRFSRQGILGSAINCPKGLPPGSDTAILSIFGQDPRVCYTGRSPLEAAATGIHLNPGDVSYRCNMITLEEGEKPFREKHILSHSGGSIDGESSIRLISDLFADPDFFLLAKEAGMMVHPAPSFRHIAVQAQGEIDGICLIPPHDHLGEIIGPILPSGNKNAAVLLKLMEQAYTVLKDHPINQKRKADGLLPANGVWFWAEGKAVSLKNFYHTYGHHGTVISAVPLCQGIASLTGLNFVEIPGATGELETNYEGKVQAALDVLRNPDQDFVAVHLEAPDECTHNGDLTGKLQAIEWLDSRIIAPIVKPLEEAGEDYRILIISDHKTLTSTRGHDGDPVPFVIYDSRNPKGSGLDYTEKNGLTGPMLDSGTALMGILFEKEV